MSPRRRSRSTVRPSATAARVSPRRRRARETDQHRPQVHLPAATRQVVSNAVGIRHEAHAVSLPNEQVRQCASNHARVVKLADAVRARVRHRRARIERDLTQQVRGLAKLLRVQPVRPREELPVDVLQIVARAIVPILAELRAVAVKGTAMQPGDRAVDDDAGDEIEVGERREDGRVQHQRRAASSSRRTISSESMPSASAWKFTSTRCRKTGNATASTSSKSTTVRPSSSARAFAPSSSD